MAGSSVHFVTQQIQQMIQPPVTDGVVGVPAPSEVRKSQTADMDPTTVSYKYLGSPLTQPRRQPLTQPNR